MIGLLDQSAGGNSSSDDEVAMGITVYGARGDFCRGKILGADLRTT
jgi:hypothetical protein